MKLTAFDRSTDLTQPIGRPPKVDRDALKSQRVTAPVTVAQKAKLEREAQRNGGKTVAQFIRAWIDAGCPI